MFDLFHEILIQLSMFPMILSIKLYLEMSTERGQRWEAFSVLIPATYFMSSSLSPISLSISAKFSISSYHHMILTVESNVVFKSST